MSLSSEDVRRAQQLVRGSTVMEFIEWLDKRSDRRFDSRHGYAIARILHSGSTSCQSRQQIEQLIEAWLIERSDNE